MIQLGSMNRRELIEAILRLSPSLPGARQPTAELLERQETAALCRRAQRLERVAAARRPIAPSPALDAELARLRDERAALLRRMRSRLGPPPPAGD